MNAVEYLDFYIEVTGQAAPAYQIAVRSKAGEARTATTFPYTNAKLEAELQRLENAILYAQVGTRGRLPPQEAAVRDFGARFFDFLLPPGETRSLYYECRRLAEFEGKGVRLNLLIQPPHLAALPWEFLHDPRRRDYIALDPHTPLVRYPEVAQSVAPLPVTPPLRILGLVANPTDLRWLNVEAEQQQVMTALQPLRERGLVEVTWLPGQGWRELQQWMRPGYGPWHIFHFIGHGSFDINREEGRIFLTDDQGQAQAISATQLSRLLAFQRGTLRLAILNACEGARGGKFDVLSSTAATLVLDGLPAVLAMQYAITDSAALEFARTFYSALSDNLPVDAAVAEARNAINLQNNASLEWGTPVLTMRSQDGQLFDLTKIASSKPSVSQPAPTPAVIHQPIESSPQQQSAPVAEDVTPTVTVGAERQTQPLQVDRPTAPTPKGNQEAQPPKITKPVVRDEEQVAREATQIFQDEDKAGQVVQPPANKRKWWGVVFGILGVVLLLYFTIYWINSRPPAAVTIAFSTPPSTVSAGLLWTNPGGFDFHYVPQGAFMMGSADGADDEQPVHEVAVDAFWMMQTEVTNAQYAAFIEAGGYRERNYWSDAGWDWRNTSDVTYPRYWYDSRFNDANQPVVGVGWYEAVAYTRWLSATTGLTIRLPTEAEWEWAARGDDGRIYPWGHEWLNDRANIDGTADGYQYTAPVGSYPAGAGPYGALDMAGNVSEWTATKWLDNYENYADLVDNSVEGDGSVRRVERGGSWFDGQDDVRAAYRFGGTPDNWNDILGFRVVLSVAPQ